MSVEAIKAIEEEGKKYAATAGQRNIKKTVIVANPSDLISPLVEVPSQDVQGTPFLGERVMNIKGSGAIPFGLQGTVVGIIDGLLEVVFDKEFIGGINLGHRYTLIFLFCFLVSFLSFFLLSSLSFSFSFLFFLFFSFLFFRSTFFLLLY